MAMRSQTVRAFPYGVVLLLTACGGGGGNGGSSSGGAGGGGSTVPGTGFAPSTGPGDTAGYFPVASGDQWQFNYSTTDPKAVAPTAVVTVSVNGTKSVLGTTATVLTQTNPTIATGGYDQYVSVSPGGVTDLGNSNAGDTITPLIVPYVQMLFPVQLGTVSTVTGQNLPAGKDPSGNAITLDMTQIIANASMETVDVPAGSYAGALKQVTTVSGAAHDNGQSRGVSGSDTGWFVAGIGEVKETISSASGGVMLSSSAELRAAIVNGQTHGLGAARDLVAVSPAMASIYAPTLPVIASDGTNFLIVTLRASVSGGAWQQNWQGTLVAADGTVLSSFNITAPVSTTLSGGGVRRHQLPRRLGRGTGAARGRARVGRGGGSGCHTDRHCASVVALLRLHVSQRLFRRHELSRDLPRPPRSEQHFQRDRFSRTNLQGGGTAGRYARRGRDCRDFGTGGTARPRGERVQGWGTLDRVGKRRSQRAIRFAGVSGGDRAERVAERLPAGAGDRRS